MRTGENHWYSTFIGILGSSRFKGNFLICCICCLCREASSLWLVPALKTSVEKKLPPTKPIEASQRKYLIGSAWVTCSLPAPITITREPGRCLWSPLGCGNTSAACASKICFQRAFSADKARQSTLGGEYALERWKQQAWRTENDQPQNRGRRLSVAYTRTELLTNYLFTVQNWSCSSRLETPQGRHDLGPTHISGLILDPLLILRCHSPHWAALFHTVSPFLSSRSSTHISPT